jgi:hypothetical protein
VDLDGVDSHYSQPSSPIIHVVSSRTKSLRYSMGRTITIARTEKGPTLDKGSRKRPVCRPFPAK